jgi:hypothetical protein
MATVPELLERFASAPVGSGIAAFSDYGGTVIDRFIEILADWPGAERKSQGAADA